MFVKFAKINVCERKKLKEKFYITLIFCITL